MPRYRYERMPYATPPELAGGRASDAPVIIVGAGPIGLSAAVDLARHGIRSVLIDDNDVVSIGSRAICWAKRSLEILDRLGVGQRMLDKGVTWKVGRLFHRHREVYAFDLLPQDGHRMPAFVNLQQYYVEEYLIDRARELSDFIDLRWRNELTGLERDNERVRCRIDTPDGQYTLEGRYLLACDGAKSTVRRLMRLDFEGRVFEERFLIADVEMQADFPSERWFWFEPPFHNGQSALLHKQPDNIYRIDLQLGWNVDPETEKTPERVIPRIEAMVGHRDFALDWVSVYTFQCRRLDHFVHGNVIFVGDSAHIVSPFGARGGNGGIHDVDNLGWKLAAVLRGRAPPTLLDTYDEERGRGADQNLRNSARATSFMTPRTEIEKLFRDEVLHLADRYPFARRLVNSGRLSAPCSLAGMSLQTPPDNADTGGVAPGEACPDAPVATLHGKGWLLHHLGDRFVVMRVGDSPPPELPGSVGLHIRTRGSPEEAAPVDVSGYVSARYGEGVTYLIRPDQHVAARFEAPDSVTLSEALARATGHGEDSLVA